MNTHTNLHPNKDMILTHINLIAAIAETSGIEGKIEIAWSDPRDHQVKHAQHFLLDQQEEAAEFAASKNKIPGQNVYIGASLRHSETPSGKRSGKENFLSSGFVWADFDDEGSLDAAKAIWRDAKTPPSFVVITGTRPHKRAHVWWELVGAIHYRKEIEEVLEAIKTTYPNSDPAVLEAAHVMRLAGTISYPKPDKVNRGYEIELTELKLNKNARKIKPREFLDQARSKKQIAPEKVTGFKELLNQNPHEKIKAELENSKIKGNWHNSIRSATATAVGLGMTNEQIKKLCAPYCIGGETDQDLDVLLEGARKKFDPGNLPLNEHKISIVYDPADVNAVVEQSERALVALGDIFQRGGFLVRPELATLAGFDGTISQQALVRSLSVPAISENLSRHVQFYKLSRTKNGDLKQTPITPPETISKYISVRQDVWPFPPISSVTTTPTINPDGTINTTPGYDPTTRVYLLSCPDMEAIPEMPTKADAEQAIQVLESLIEEFPFVTDVDKSVALSGILTACGRGMYSVCPMHVADAPTPGSGKSYLMDTISTLATSSLGAVISWSSQDAENEKRIDGALLDGSPLIILDNVTGSLGSDKLCQAVERPYVRVRKLGGSDGFEVENRSLTLATGNNIVIKGDLSRRTLITRLDPKVERPELREFRARPTDLIKQDRGRYIRIALIVLRAYVVAGRPDKLRPLASFEAWSDSVRSALVWLGRADPVESMQAVIENDPERILRQMIFEEIHRGFGASEMTLAQLISRVEERRSLEVMNDFGDEEGVSPYRFPELRDALLEAAGKGQTIDKGALGLWCRNNKDRLTNGYILRSKTGRTTMWSVLKTN